MLIARGDLLLESENPLFPAMGIEKESSFCYSATLSGRREQDLFAIQVKKYISSNLPRTCRVAIIKSSLFNVLEVSEQLKLSNVLVRSVPLEISFSYYSPLTRTLTTLTVSAASSIHHKFQFIISSNSSQVLTLDKEPIFDEIIIQAVYHFWEVTGIIYNDIGNRLRHDLAFFSTRRVQTSFKSRTGVSKANISQ